MGLSEGSTWTWASSSGTVSLQDWANRQGSSIWKSFGFRDEDAPGYYPGLYMCFTAIFLGIVSECTTSVYMFLQNRKHDS